jgi:hypothetical protein
MPVFTKNYKQQLQDIGVIVYTVSVSTEKGEASVESYYFYPEKTEGEEKIELFWPEYFPMIKEVRNWKGKEVVSIIRTIENEMIRGIKLFYESVSSAKYDPTKDLNNLGFWSVDQKFDLEDTIASSAIKLSDIEINIQKKEEDLAKALKEDTVNKEYVSSLRKDIINFKAEYNLATNEKLFTKESLRKLAIATKTELP